MIRKISRRFRGKEFKLYGIYGTHSLKEIIKDLKKDRSIRYRVIKASLKHDRRFNYVYFRKV